jgi:hypothetical protein
MPAKLNSFKTPASVRLFQVGPCPLPLEYQAATSKHRQTAMPGQKSIYETFLVKIFLAHNTTEKGVVGNLYTYLWLLPVRDVNCPTAASMKRILLSSADKLMKDVMESSF